MTWDRDSFAVDVLAEFTERVSHDEEWTYWARRQTARKVASDRACATCGAPFTPASNVQRFCSARCQNRRRTERRAKSGNAPDWHWSRHGARYVPTVSGPKEAA